MEWRKTSISKLRYMPSSWSRLCSLLVHILGVPDALIGFRSVHVAYRQPPCGGRSGVFQVVC